MIFQDNVQVKPDIRRDSDIPCSKNSLKSLKDENIRIPINC